MSNSHAEFVCWVIRTARGKQSQAAFAQQLQIHRRSLINYEHGKRIPDAVFLLRIFDMLNGHPIVAGYVSPPGDKAFDAAGFPFNSLVWGTEGCGLPLPDQVLPPTEQPT